MSDERGTGIRTLPEELAAKLAGTVAIVGVGDAGHGDDGAGPMLVNLLAIAGVRNVVDGGTTPELETWKVRCIAPDTVLFVDAVDLGVEPGDAALLRPVDLRAGGCETHRAPLRLTMQYLEGELGCRCYLLAVQPRDARAGAAMSDDVRSSVEVLARMLLERLRERN
jgi:hydrogenase 3 maturation protease